MLSSLRSAARVIAPRAVRAMRAPASRALSTTARTASASALPASRLLTTAVVATTALGAGLLLTEDESVAMTGSIPHYGVPGTAQERTFIAIKPDGVQRGLIGDIIKRFERRGYKLVAMKLIWPTEARAKEHYADLSKKPFFPSLTKYFSSGPIVAMVWEGYDAILTGRKLLGATNPLDSAPGTIRGDYCIITGRNIIHGSDGPDSAEHEIKMWFSPDEVFNYDSAMKDWIYGN